jgi:flagellar biosynthesis/type III secretory pathway M-ring protein FliF/YscJ
MFVNWSHRFLVESFLSVGIVCIILLYFLIAVVVEERESGEKETYDEEKKERKKKRKKKGVDEDGRNRGKKRGSQIPHGHRRLT